VVTSFVKCIYRHPWYQIYVSDIGPCFPERILL